MSLVKFAAATAGTLAAGAYLNAKHHIAHDLSLTRLIPDKFIAARVADKNRIAVYHTLQDRALRVSPDAIFLIFEDRQYSYAEFYKAVVRAGNWLMKDLGIREGEIVALDGGNTPEYLILWYALEGIGAVSSFVNNNLTGKSLLHCIALCECRYLLCDRDNQYNVGPCEEELTVSGVKTIYYDSSSIANLTDDLPIPDSRLAYRNLESLSSLLYTSGSTGLPKAVIMIQGRELSTSFVIARYLRLKPSDRLYTCMPLYHGAAHGLGVTPVIHAGATLVLGRKFSHSKFWPEVRKSKANIIQYVGELCRYLINAPESPLDKDNNVRMAWGNGMRPDVWQKFRDRFGIETINELYAATDGLGTSLNESQNDFTRNAVGKRGLIWKLMRGKSELPVKIDVDTEDILREENGFAIKCATNEPGEIIHKLDPAAPDSQFQGYWKNRGAGEKRKIRDVFEKGDLWFRSGDMLRTDHDGRVYFVDRLGDTFRWKSENVSTNEVSDVLGLHPHIAEANVYGVTVPNADGRCGMAAIVMPEHITIDKFDFKGVARHVLNALPRYAIPHFLRITPQLDYTGTLKIQKGRLKREGIDVDTVEGNGDLIYWLTDGAEEYVPFTKEHHKMLVEGRARL
ncbi:hypothetical protein FKW77_000215 [Venturia effusa]|uniref:Very long-chain fatty acid transport protein n=1 Tax=Venturia effusa TaxID=50376 RepID=A0A517LA70_9PEZI|nr:hypothetical protein FKW77_000215 [Venturia effusa]